MNFETQDYSGRSDIPNQRTIELENGNKLHLVRKDPFGFIYLHLDKGALPPYLAGAAFTDWTAARQAADKYQRERKLVVAEITEQTDKKK